MNKLAKAIDQLISSAQLFQDELHQVKLIAEPEPLYQHLRRSIPVIRFVIHSDMAKEINERFHIRCSKIGGVHNASLIKLSTIKKINVEGFVQLSILAFVRQLYPNDSIPRQVVVSRERSDTRINTDLKKLFDKANPNPNNTFPYIETISQNFRLRLPYYIELDIEIKDSQKDNMLTGLDSLWIIENMINEIIKNIGLLKKNGTPLIFEDLIIEEIQNPDWLHLNIDTELEDYFKGNRGLLTQYHFKPPLA